MGENGKVKEMEIVEVKWEKSEDGRMNLAEVPGTEQTIPADLVLLSMGFVHPVHEGLVEELKLEKNKRGNIKVRDNSQSASNQKVFAAGDAVSGASLVVRAIFNARETARHIHEYLVPV